MTMLVGCNSVRRSHMVMFTKSERQMPLQDMNVVVAHERESKVIVQKLQKMSSPPLSISSQLLFVGVGESRFGGGSSDLSLLLNFS